MQDLVLSLPQVDGSIGNTESIIHASILAGSLQDDIKRLQHRDWRLNRRDRQGWAPLHLAVGLGQVHSVHLLLGWGADPDVLDSNLHTPLHLCDALSKFDIAQALLDRGANARILDENYQSVLHFAVTSRSQSDLIQFINAVISRCVSFRDS